MCLQLGTSSFLVRLDHEVVNHGGVPIKMVRSLYCCYGGPDDYSKGISGCCTARGRSFCER